MKGAENIEMSHLHLFSVPTFGPEVDLSHNNRHYVISCIDDDKIDIISLYTHENKLRIHSSLTKTAQDIDLVGSVHCVDSYGGIIFLLTQSRLYAINLSVLRGDLKGDGQSISTFLDLFVAEDQVQNVFPCPHLYISPSRINDDHSHAFIWIHMRNTLIAVHIPSFFTFSRKYIYFRLNSDSGIIYAQSFLHSDTLVPLCDDASVRRYNDDESVSPQTKSQASIFLLDSNGDVPLKLVPLSQSIFQSEDEVRFYEGEDDSSLPLTPIFNFAMSTASSLFRKLPFGIQETTKLHLDKHPHLKKVIPSSSRVDPYFYDLGSPDAVILLPDESSHHVPQQEVITSKSAVITNMTPSSGSSHSLKGEAHQHLTDSTPFDLFSATVQHGPTSFHPLKLNNVRSGYSRVSDRMSSISLPGRSSNPVYNGIPCAIPSVLAAVMHSDRVALLSSTNLTVLRLWKGYRGAMTAFIDLPPSLQYRSHNSVNSSNYEYHSHSKEKSFEGSYPAVGGREYPASGRPSMWHSIGELDRRIDDDDFHPQSTSTIRMALAIYAPNRGVIDVWPIRFGDKITSVKAPKGGRLLVSNVVKPNSTIILGSRLFILTPGEEKGFNNNEKLSNHIQHLWEVRWV